jgi:hypothetical protein
VFVCHPAVQNNKQMTNKHFIQWLCLLAICLSASLSCGSDDAEAPVPEEPIVARLDFITSETLTVAGQLRPVALTVKAYDASENQLINPDYVIQVNGEDAGKFNTFKSDEPGEFKLKAVSGTVESPEVRIKVREKKTYEQRTYRVIFHIVHDGEALGIGYNIGAERISYQMGLLEKVFEKGNNLTPNSTLPNLDFQLATRDPLGNILSEPGINRFQRPDPSASILFEDWMWDHYWDPDYYINVWVGDTKNGYSWGIYPEFACDGADGLEGIGCTSEADVHRLEGIALELNNLQNENWVFPHEMGHLFGLFHIFSGSECNMDVDFCQDTKQYDRNAYENGATGNTRISCEGEEFTSYNVMDYWQQPNGARDLTYEQVERIRTVVDGGLWRGSKSLDEGTPRDMSTIRNGG